jgi:hypothetical protein
MRKRSRIIFVPSGLAALGQLHQNAWPKIHGQLRSVAKMHQFILLCEVHETLFAELGLPIVLKNELDAQ